MIKLIIFVCKGNIHRSVVAEICLKQELEKFGLSSQFEIISRGIQGCCGTAMPKYENITKYEMEWSITMPILENLGINLSEMAKHIATPITKDDVERADAIYAMELNVLGKNPDNLPNSLLCQFPEYHSKMYFFGEIEGKTNELLDCGESKDQELHLLINERIVYGIRNNMQSILNQTKKGGKND